MSVHDGSRFLVFQHRARCRVSMIATGLEFASKQTDDDRMAMTMTVLVVVPAMPMTTLQDSEREHKA